MYNLYIDLTYLVLEEASKRSYVRKARVLVAGNPTKMRTQQDKY